MRGNAARQVCLVVVRAIRWVSCVLPVYELISIFSDHDAPVLVTGDTGTGKELVARALHHSGRRSNMPFVPIACGTIPSELAESELFGHEKGSFTGAHQRREGSFERADGGTVLLDDIDDLPLNMQVKLLRVLQEGTLIRVGGIKEFQVDVRIVATSKVDLLEAIEKGTFRDDLFYRLRGLEVTLPPLRERGEDVLLLAHHFLELVKTREGKEAKTLSIEAADKLRSYPWPGNVRELRRAMESAFILCKGDEIRAEHLPTFLTRLPIKRSSGGDHELFKVNFDGKDELPFTELVQQFEDTMILWALSKAAGQQTKAAELLGLPRTTFQSKIASSSSS